jgi:hypothetical protein
MIPKIIVVVLLIFISVFLLRYLNIERFSTSVADSSSTSMENNTSAVINMYPNFKDTMGLQCFNIVEKTQPNTNPTQVMKDITSFNRDIVFERPINIEDGNILLENNRATLGKAKDIMRQTFTIIFSYKGIEYENGSLIQVPVINDINSGVNIEFQNDVGINNKLVITIGAMKYVYEIGISQKNTQYAVIFNSGSGTIKLYVDGFPLSPKVKIPLTSINRPRGTCPDSWKYTTTKECVYLSRNRGSCAKTIYNFTNNPRLVNYVINRCGLKWTNCKQLNPEEIAPDDNSNCKVNTDLNFTDSPILVNSNMSLKGSLQALVIYKRELSKEEIQRIGTLLYAHGISEDIESIYNRPNIDNIATVSTTTQQPVECIFSNKELCSQNDCKNVNWDNPVNVSEQCRMKVNEYCRGNTEDSGCVNLRDKKNKMNESVKLHKSVDDTDCKGCHEKVDLSKYIRKDKIPCWGCNLE